MVKKQIPSPSILDKCTFVRVEGGRKYYVNPDEDVYYSWDSLHGELEIFNKGGYHLGAACPKTGIIIKPPVKGRRVSKFN